MVCIIYLDFSSITVRTMLPKTVNITISVVWFTVWIKGNWHTSWLRGKMQINHSAINTNYSTKCNISHSQSLNQLVYLHWLNLAPSTQYQVHKSKKTLKLNALKDSCRWQSFRWSWQYLMLLRKKPNFYYKAVRSS